VSVVCAAEGPSASSLHRYTVNHLWNTCVSALRAAATPSRAGQQLAVRRPDGRRPSHAGKPGVAGQAAHQSPATFSAEAAWKSPAKAPGTPSADCRGAFHDGRRAAGPAHAEIVNVHRREAIRHRSCVALAGAA
jgi:hypothetical protein